jgi:magnesium chelatase accessory protein
MMAAWDLRPLQRDLPRLSVDLTLVAAARDRTINPAEAARSAHRVPNGHVVRMKNLGHLAHEEDPAQAATIIREAIARAATPA